VYVACTMLMCIAQKLCQVIHPSIPIRSPRTPVVSKFLNRRCPQMIHRPVPSHGTLPATPPNAPSHVSRHTVLPRLSRDSRSPRYLHSSTLQRHPHSVGYQVRDVQADAVSPTASARWCKCRSTCPSRGRGIFRPSLDAHSDGIQA